MSVRQDKYRDPKTGAWKKYWAVDITFQHPDGRTERIRKVSPMNTKRGAEQYERSILQELLAGTYGQERKEEKTPTLEQFSKDFLTTYAATNNKPSEVDSKKMICERHLVPALGDLRLDKIGPKEIERYKGAKLASKLCAKTVNNHLTVLRRLLALAVEWGHITHVPPVKWLKCPEPEFDFLTFEEADRLLEAASREPEWYVMIIVGLRCGLRQGELIGLRWDDADLVAGIVVVRQSIVRGRVGTPKNGKKREVPLGNEVLAALKSHRHLKGELVFSNPDGSAFGKEQCKHPLWRACKRAGLRRIGWHVLRHSFASHLVMKGVPLKAVQELLGHSTIEMTMRYAHLSPDVRRDAVLKLDRRADTTPDTSTSNGRQMGGASS